MNLNVSLEEINLDNYNKVVDEINNFKCELDKKYDLLRKEAGKATLAKLKTEPIRDIDYCRLYKIDRIGIQELFCEGIEDMGFDSHGFYDNLDCDSPWFENDTFMIRPYSWSDSDCTCSLAEKEDESYRSCGKHKELGLHSIDCYNSSDRIVNFWYKPTNLKISWYKYPMRSAYSNQELDTNYLRAVLEECKHSLEK